MIPTSLPGPMLPVPFAVRRVVAETPDVFTVTLVPPTPSGFSFEPGQFNMLYLFGIGEVAISISGDSEVRSELVHTIRAVGHVTHAMQTALGKLAPDTSSIGVRGPFGRGWPLHEARGRDLLLIAGGLGLAPLRPAVYYALRHRAEFRNVRLLVGARSPEDMAFQQEVSKWAATANIEVMSTVDRATPAWKGHVGVVPALLGRAPIDPGQTTAFICGPEVMMRYCQRELARVGVADEQIFVSLERNMKCAVGFCGHCQLGPNFLCKDGPVLPFDAVSRFFSTREA